MPLAQPADTEPAERRYPVEVTATAGEYFRIWIVNLALTVITLGIYSAWAKVRKRRYFYSHTRIDGEGFEYRAKPIPILKGRLIALFLFALVYGAAYISLLSIIPALIAGLFVLPWLIVRSLAFNARNTAYRNLTFHFRGEYWPCLKIVLVYCFWVAITFGIMLIAYPYFKRKLVNFALENHYYGTTRFSAADFKKPFIHAYSTAIGLGILFGVPAGAIAGFGKTSGSALVSFVTLLPTYAVYFALLSYVRTRTLNAVWNNVSIGTMRFASTLRARDMMAIYVTNAAAVVFTLGLATPWAVVRTMRYRAEHTSVIAAGNLDDFVQAESQQVSAAGEEVGEVFDIDVAL